MSASASAPSRRGKYTGAQGRECGADWAIQVDLLVCTRSFVAEAWETVCSTCENRLRRSPRVVQLRWRRFEPMNGDSTQSLRSPAGRRIRLLRTASDPGRRPYPFAYFHSLRRKLTALTLVLAL